MSEAIEEIKTQDEVKDELFKIIADYCKIDKNSLDLSMGIEDDLGCVGDDAYDIVEEICIKFGINCKEFSPGDVTDVEGIDYRKSFLNPDYLYKMLFDREKVTLPKFTIGMLLKAIETKKLKSVKPEGYYYAKEVIVE